MVLQEYIDAVKAASRRVADITAQMERVLPAFLSSWRDDRAEIWIHKEFSEGAFHLQYDITGTIEFEPFIGDGGAGDIAAQLFELVALTSGAAHRSMEAVNPCWLAQHCGVGYASKRGTVCKLNTF